MCTLVWYGSDMLTVSCIQSEGSHVHVFHSCQSLTLCTLQVPFLLIVCVFLNIVKCKYGSVVVINHKLLTYLAKIMIEYLF